jgi:hypothetical protein
MALPASGQITLNQVNVELGNSGTAQIGMNDAAVRGLFGIASGEIKMSDGYGKSSETVLTNEGTINGQSNRKQITVSNFISAGGTLVVPSGFWVWSDDNSVPAMIVDIPCTIRNEGKVIGKGGNSSPRLEPSAAIKINSGVSGVTIQNSSGAYIAGGGGAGGNNGGGGAGGGNGSDPYTSPPQGGGYGGELNAAGELGSIGYTQASVQQGRGQGGGAGGGGGSMNYIYPYGYPANGGGGGRILTGSGGAGGYGYSGARGGDGGSGGSAGGNPVLGVYGGGGGGGGWGAYGSNGNTNGGSLPAGSAGASAIDDSGVSYTLTKNGTIYGAT